MNNELNSIFANWKPVPIHKTRIYERFDARSGICPNCHAPSINTCICRDDEPCTTYEDIELHNSAYNKRNNYFGDY